ncbi:MAG: hypothetical protein ACFFA1_06055 [Promethearchaeota archaeon]
MSEGEFRRGAISQILLFVSALLLSLSYLISTAIGFLEVVLLSFASYIFLLIFAAVFLSVTGNFVDKYRGSPVGKTASMFGIIVSMVGIIAYFILPIFPILLMYYIAYSMDYLAFGGIAILTGAFFLKYREYFSNKGSWGLTGTVHIVTGFALFISMAGLYLPGFLFSYLAVGFLLLLVAVMGIIGAISFLTAKPVESSREEEST